MKNTSTTFLFFSKKLRTTSVADNAVSLSQKHLPIKGLGVKIGRLASLQFLKGHEHENRKVQIDESAS